MQSVGLVLTPPLAGPEKAAGATSPAPPGEGRENVRNHILSVMSGILPSALPRASRFSERQTNKQKIPPCFPLPAPVACGAVTKEAALPISRSQPFKQTRIGQGKTPAKIPPPILFFRPKLENRAGQAWFGILRTAKGPSGWKRGQLSVLWGEDGGLGEVSAQRVNVLFHWHFSRVPRVLITALHKSKSSEGDFLLSSHGHLDTKAAAEGPSPGEGTAGIIPQGREERAEAEGQGRSALGRHDVELLAQAEGLFLGPPSPPARNLRRTLGDPGTGLMVTWSNRQLTASVPGAGGGEERAPCFVPADATASCSACDSAASTRLWFLVQGESVLR